MVNLNTNVNHSRKEVSGCHVYDVIPHDGMATTVISTQSGDQDAIAKYGEEEDNAVREQLGKGSQ